MGETLMMVAGSDRDFVFTARAKVTGLPITTFLPTDALSCRLWPGDDLGTVVTPAISWLDSALARYQVQFLAADTAALVPQTYRFQTLVTRSGRSVVLFDGAVRLSGAPGLGVAPAVYGPFADMQTYASWIDDLRTENDQAGFAEARGRARAWIDDVILDRFRGSGYGSQLAIQSFGDPSLFSGSGSGGDDRPSDWLRTLLAGGGLIVRDRTREIAAKKAISIVCEAQVGMMNSTPYQALAAQYRRDASSLIKTYRAEIDTNADGLAELTIHCGATTVR